ncbi:MAG TPA: HAMP domain-containing sensor histidine kinase [Polyangiaceae bacterium]|nr:HAMP domain-containing sensor histidine kinase [Polyangiaceae bacterium]
MTGGTIFWTTVKQVDRPALEEARGLHAVQLVVTTPAELARFAMTAMLRGPTLCVVDGDRSAGQALALGIDEILRAGEVTRDSLAAALGRAAARAAARTSPEYRHALLDQDEEAAFAQLGAAFGERLQMPLSMASADCAAVVEAMNSLIDIDDQFVAWTALVAPADQFRSLVARRLAAPTGPELKGVLRRLSASIGRAESLVRLLRDLTRSDDDGDLVVVAPLLSEIVDVMGPLIKPLAEVTIRADAKCATTATRTTLVVVVGALLASALESIRAASLDIGHITVRAFEEEDALVIEIRDDGREIPSDLRPSFLETTFSASEAPRGGLPGLRERVRRAGGDLLVDSRPGESTVRVFLPSRRSAATVREVPTVTAPELPARKIGS